MAGMTNIKCAANANTIKDAIRAQMDNAAFDSWIMPLSFSAEQNTLVVSAHNQFSHDFIERTYLPTIRRAAAEYGMGVMFVVGAHMAPAVRATNDNNTPKPIASNLSVKTSLLSFDSFVCGDENAFALSACKKFAAGNISFSPLFIYGASGAGKSMLAECMRGACAGKTVMMTGGEFVSAFQRAITEHNIFAFKDFVRNCDNFILDDVGAICGKRATTDEFLETLSDLIKMGKNVAIFSSVQPAALSGFDRRLQSVLASGLVVDIAVPNQNVRREMIVRAGVPADVADTLSARTAADGHLVAGIIKKISAWRELMGTEITIDTAETLLSDCITKQKTPTARARGIAAKLGVSFEDVCSSSRVRTIVRARQIIMTVLKQTTTLSLSEIGRIVGDRDHATVLYALSQTEKLRACDLMLSAEIDGLMQE